MLTRARRLGVNNGLRTYLKGVVLTLTKTVLGVFTSEQAAEKAVRALRDKGFGTNEISIIQKSNQGNQGADSGLHRSNGTMSIGGSGIAGGTSNGGRVNTSTNATTDEIGTTGDTTSGGYTTGTDSVTDGAVSGATWGGLAGLALGAGALAVPGIGPLLAAGPLAAALTGAATGGLAGGLIDWGVPESVGREYETHVRQGGVLAVIRVSEKKADDAANILRENGARDVGMHDSTK